MTEVRRNRPLLSSLALGDRVPSLLAESPADGGLGHAELLS